MDPLEWQISQDTASNIVARLANTVGAAEAVLRVAATGHDKRLFVKAMCFLSLPTYYTLDAIIRISKCISISILLSLPICIVLYTKDVRVMRFLLGCNLPLLLISSGTAHIRCNRCLCR